MTIFRTCHTCAKPQATCVARAALQASLAGLGVTSLKHRCTDYLAAFLPGEAVRVLTIPFYPTDDEPVAPQRWFPGHFVKLTGTRALVFVKPGSRSLDVNHRGEEFEFEAHGSGYLKVPLRRVAARDGEPVSIEACRWCASIPSLDGNCGRDPHYTPRRDCLAEQHAADQSRATAERNDRTRDDQHPHSPPLRSEGEG